MASPGDPIEMSLERLNDMYGQSWGARENLETECRLNSSRILSSLGWDEAYPGEGHRDGNQGDITGVDLLEGRMSS